MNLSIYVHATFIYRYVHVGATINMYPELCQAAVADVPFVDVVNTMADPSIPLTVGEWVSEWMGV